LYALIAFDIYIDFVVNLFKIFTKVEDIKTKAIKRMG